MEKIRKNTLKRRLKAKTVSETYPDRSYIRVSNYIKIIVKEHVRFHLPRGLQKSFIKEKWIEIGKEYTAEEIIVR